MAFVLTVLLFFTFISSHDPTLGELANRSKSLGHATRETLEEAGDWAAQDKWRLAHLFVDHRPKRDKLPDIDTSVLDDFPDVLQVSSRRESRPRSGFNIQSTAVERQRPVTRLSLPDTEVRLDLGSPPVAEQPRRLVAGQYVHEAGAEFHPVRQASYRSRDSRLLVQAEWSFARDCDAEPVRRPSRRLIPVPDPQWEDLPPIPEQIDDRHPDLSFQMLMLREFLPPTSEHPPRSRNASVAATSEFPESFAQHDRSHLLTQDSSRWARTTKDRTEHHRHADAYVDRLQNDPFGTGDENLPVEHELHLNSAPSFAEVALRLELQAPETTLAGHVNKSMLVLHNDGLVEIPQVTVRESLSGLKTVTDAIPPARVVSSPHRRSDKESDLNIEEPLDHTEKSLERTIQHLPAGKQQRLELVWRPDTVGHRTHSAIVTVQAAVGATTEIVLPAANQPMPSVTPEPVPIRELPIEPDPEAEPEPAAYSEPPVISEPDPAPEAHPGLSFDVRNLPRATVDDLVEIAIVVRNTGDVPLHGVRVIAHLPEQLKHRRGSEVEFTINELPVRGSERAVLRVVAQLPGRAVCRLQVASDEPAEADSTTSIDVVARPVRLETPSVAKTEPVRPKPVPVPPPAPKRTSPAPKMQNSNCCCQAHPVAPYEPWFIP